MITQEIPNKFLNDESDSDTSNVENPSEGEPEQLIPVTKDPRERSRLLAALSFLSNLQPHEGVSGENARKNGRRLLSPKERKTSQHVIHEVEEALGSFRGTCMKSMEIVGSHSNEKSLPENMSLANRRLLYVSGGFAPSCITSVIPFDPKKDHSVFDRRRCHVFLSNPNRIKMGSHKAEFEQIPEPYQCDLIDNPDMKFSKHRTVLTLPGFRGSILGYVDENTKQIDRDKTFSKHYENLDSSITLTRIDRSKRYLGAIVSEIDAEMVIASIACIIFEKLILRNVLSKHNLGITVACALILSAKFIDTDRETLLKLFSKIYQVLRIKKSVILQWEFTIFAEIGFDLNFAAEDIMYHFRRLCEMQKVDPAKYLGRSGQTISQLYGPVCGCGLVHEQVGFATDN